MKTFNRNLLSFSNSFHSRTAQKREYTDLLFETTLKQCQQINQLAERLSFEWSQFSTAFSNFLQILFDKFKSSIVDSMCNLLIAVFRGKFAEAVDLGEKEKLEIPEGWGGGGCSKTLWNGNSRGVGGSKVKNLPWGVWIFSGTAHF